MGVSISLNGKSITPGWRSTMYTLLMDNFTALNPDHDTFRYILYPNDIPRLEHCRDNQAKGYKEPPFDWADDIAESFDKIIEEVKEKGEAKVDCQH